MGQSLRRHVGPLSQPITAEMAPSVQLHVSHTCRIASCSHYFTLHSYMLIPTSHGRSRYLGDCVTLPSIPSDFSVEMPSMQSIKPAKECLRSLGRAGTQGSEPLSTAWFDPVPAFVSRALPCYRAKAPNPLTRTCDSFSSSATTSLRTSSQNKRADRLYPPVSSTQAVVDSLMRQPFEKYDEAVHFSPEALSCAFGLSWDISTEDPSV